MDLIAETRRRDADLARWIESLCEQELRFDGEHPNDHSYLNHVHLFALERAAEAHGWIDLGFRVRLAETILGRWRTRLRGLRASLPRGARLYLYEDMAPTVSVVAETDIGFPYPGTPTFVSSAKEIMALYVGRRWSDHFVPGGGPSERAILAAVERHAGSIGAPTAQALGLGPGSLRKLVEGYDLQDEVNAIRKRFRRRPARFRIPYEMPHGYRIYEERVPPEP